MINRSIVLPRPNTETFFLWGPRQTGKSFWLKHTYPEALRINLLETNTYSHYLSKPSRLRDELLSKKEKPFVIIDEIQKIPPLLDEVHLLIEDYGFYFGLCGSSARKLRRAHANMLGGRAVRYELLGLSANELDKQFDLDKLLNNGYLPSTYLSTKPRTLWRSYVADYLKDEIAAESAVRNLPAFSEFLRLASLSDSELLSFESFSQEVGVAAKTIKGYFEILQDTFIGQLLPSYTRKAKRRIIETSKFYFFDIGLVNYLAEREKIKPKTEIFGKALENWVHHELRSFIAYRDVDRPLFYWRLAGGTEVDFVLGRKEPVAIEVKGSTYPTRDDFKGLREFKIEFEDCSAAVLVCNTEKSFVTDDNILVLSPKDFVSRLWNDKDFTTSVKA